MIGWRSRTWRRLTGEGDDAAAKQGADQTNGEGQYEAKASEHCGNGADNDGGVLRGADHARCCSAVGPSAASVPACVANYPAYMQGASRKAGSDTNDEIISAWTLLKWLSDRLMCCCRPTVRASVCCCICPIVCAATLICIIFFNVYLPAVARAHPPLYDVDGNKIDAHGGQMLRYDGVIYWYGERRKTLSRDGFPIGVNQGWTNDGVSCYWSMDMRSWHNAGTVFSNTSVSLPPDQPGPYVIERPKVIFNAGTEQFVMWFHLDSFTYSYRVRPSRSEQCA
mmetsp:Transcript_18244/g.39372  ORF Transcript_18244/g.39372 Transcript_18244/m.39372 type:complete len:281 (-) Transcript_18244:161-1003(-)